MNKIVKKIVAIATVLTLSVTVVSPAQGATIEELQALINGLLAQITSLQAQLTSAQSGGTTGVACTITSFTRDLSQGMSGDDVKCLQVILNSDQSTRVASAGVGSPGAETNYFGPLTKAAAVNFQEKYASEVLAPIGLTSGTGYVGTKTRAKLNTMFGAETGTGGIFSTTVRVGLAVNTPAASAVAAGAQDVEFTNVTFSAGSQPYTVTSLAVTRGGISIYTNVSNVKLYDGAVQIGSTQALNSVTNKATFTNLNWIIPANTVRTLTIKGSVAAAAGAGNSIILGIASASDIVTTATLSGTFPINGNSKTVATQGVGTLTADMLATPAASSPFSGSVEQHVGTLKLTSATEGFNVNSIKLTQVGTAGNADVFNVKLKYGATVLGTVASLTNSAVTFTGSPIINIPVGAKQLDIYVDTASGINTSRTIIWEVAQAADIVAIGQNSGGQITVAAAGTFPEAGATHTISQGSLVVALDTATNPTAQTYVIGTANRVFTALKFSTGAQEGARVTQITLTLTGGVAATDLSNIALYDGSTLVAGPSGITGSTVQFGYNTINVFDTVGLFDMPASTNKVITVKADISSGATANATATLSVSTSTNVKADGLVSQQDIPSGSITGSATGNLMTVGEYGSLAVGLDATAPAAQTVAKASTDLVLARYSLTAGSGEDVSVSTLIVTLWKTSGDVACVAGDLTNVSIWDGATQLGTTVAAPAATAAFNANFTVPAGTKKIITVKATIPTGTTATSTHASLLAATTAANMLSTGLSSLAAITETGDGTGALMTVGTPTLVAAAGAIPVLSTKIVNSTGVTMTTLLLTAGTAENVRISSIKITFDASDTLAAASSTASAEFANVKLMDGATQIGTTMQITDGGALVADSATFSGLNYIVTAGQQKALSVVVDIVGTDAGPWYSGHAAAGDILGTGAVSGTAVSSTGTSIEGKALTIGSYGTLAVGASSDTPSPSNVAVGVTQGAAGVEFSKFKLTAGTEAVKISRLMLTTTGGRDSDFGAVYLYDGATLVGTAYANASTVVYTWGAGSEIIVSAASDKYLTVKADLMGIGNGSTHADAPKWYIADHQADITSAGVSSQTAITETEGTISATSSANLKAKTLYKTTASVALSNLVVSGGGVPAANESVLAFTITNNGAYDLTVNSLGLTPSFTGTVGTTSDGTVAIAAYWSTTLSTVVFSTTTASTSVPALVSGTKYTMATDTNNTIPANSSKTLVIKAYTTGLTTDNNFHMDLVAVGDLSWTPDGGSAVVTGTPSFPVTGPTKSY